MSLAGHAIGLRCQISREEIGGASMLMLLVIGIMVFLRAIWRLVARTSSLNSLDNPISGPVWSASDLEIPDTVPSEWVDAYRGGE
jgi:hypothetical protein